jgi:hypothetical protein
VFARFYRVEGDGVGQRPRARDRREIARIMGGEVRLDSRRPTVFTLDLPGEPCLRRAADGDRVFT